MLQCPEARRLEFAELFADRPVMAGQRVFDIPAGGGYLSRILPEGTELLSLELTQGFGTALPLYDPGQPWQFGLLDHGVCLAALHHIEKQRQFLASLLRHLKPDGVLHVADVSATSSIRYFLDDFVGHYNETGHSGRYMATDRAFFEEFGELSRMGKRPCP